MAGRLLIGPVHARAWFALLRDAPLCAGRWLVYACVHGVPHLPRPCLHTGVPAPSAFGARCSFSSLRGCLLWLSVCCDRQEIVNAAGVPVGGNQPNAATAAAMGGNKRLPPLQMAFALKEHNAGKLDSHQINH